MNRRKPSSLTSLPLAKLCNTISGRAFGNEHAAPEVEHDVDAGLTAGLDIRQACPALRVGHAEAPELPAQNALADHARIAPRRRLRPNRRPPPCGSPRSSAGRNGARRPW